MAGLTLAQRDLAETREQLGPWVEHRFGPDTTISELTTANRVAGWSSETLTFSVAGPDDFAGQTRTQRLSGQRGVATPSPVDYERAPILPSRAVETIRG